MKRRIKSKRDILRFQSKNDDSGKRLNSENNGVVREKNTQYRRAERSNDDQQ